MLLVKEFIRHFDSRTLCMNLENRDRKTASNPPPGDPGLIIEAGMLLPMTDGAAPLKNVQVIIEGDRIIDIRNAGRNATIPQGVDVIDAKHGIVMPGLINAHAHTAMTLFRGLADDLPLKQWLFEKIFPAEAEHLSPENVYWGSLLGCLEMIASGTTTVVDGYFFQDDTVRAVHKSGLRALVAQGIIDFPAPGVEDPGENLRVGKEFLEKWIGFSDLITPGLFCHSPLTCSDRTLKQAMKISREFATPLQIHLSETAGEVDEILKRTGRRPAPYLENLGLLDHDLIAAHAIHLNDEELDLLYRKGVKIVHVPESNMKLSSGVARVPEMVKRGMAVALGTDGCASNNDLDLFREMDSTAKIHKVVNMDPENMAAETVLKMATIGGAAILGLEKEIGTIEVGKKADMIVVDLQSPHLVPLYNPLSTLVYSASGADVKDVIVNGKILMKDRAILTLEPQEIMERVRAIGRDIARD